MPDLWFDHFVMPATRLTNITDRDIEFSRGDWIGAGRCLILAGQTIDYPYDYASEELLLLLATNKIKIEDHPPPGEKPRAPGL